MFRRRPTSELEHLHDHIERIWERLALGMEQPPGFCASGFEPPADVLHTAEQVIVRIEVPGLRGSDVDIQVAADRLTVRGVKQEPTIPAAAHYAQMEIMGGAFEKSVALAAQVNVEGASVQYADGYLEIRLPRVARATTRHVRVPVSRT